MKPRQRVLDAYYPRSVRIVEVFKHGQFVPVEENHYKKALRKNRSG